MDVCLWEFTLKILPCSKNSFAKIHMILFLLPFVVQSDRMEREYCSVGSNKIIELSHTFGEFYICLNSHGIVSHGLPTPS